MSSTQQFFIVGAPKCGTTSLYRWLRTRKKVFMSNPKELYYFDKDFETDKGYINEYDQYMKCFDDVKAHHRAVGEATTTYLHSKKAIPGIEERYETPKYIVMLRHPADMAYSLHNHLIYKGEEHITDFEEAWNKSTERRQGEYVKWYCSEPKLLDYKNACRLGEQLERMLSIVPRSRAKLIFLEQLKVDPKREFDNVMTFLSIRDYRYPGFKPQNKAKEKKSRLLQRVTNNLRYTARIVREYTGPLGTSIIKNMKKINTQKKNNKKIEKALRRKVTRFFEDDIRKLSRLTDRNLNHWLYNE